MKKLTKKDIQDLVEKHKVEDREHTELSASWAKIWLHCLGAVKLSRLFPKVEDDEDFTLEGTQAHLLGELLLKGKLVKEQLPSEFYDLGFYYDKAKEIQGNGNLLVEVQVDMTQILEVPKTLNDIWGRSDFVVLAEDGGIDIGDLKWGKGVQVSAYENEQEMLYALGTLYLLDDNGLIDLKDIDFNTRVTLHIVQPRLDINYSYYNTDVGKLLEFAKFVKFQLKRIAVGVEELEQGEHCQFCKGKTFCPYFAKATENVLVELPKEFNVISQARIIELYNQKAAVMAFYRALDKYIRANIILSENGTFGGYKIVQKEGNREVVDEEALIAQFTAKGCTLAELQDVSIVGMGKLDNLAKRYNIAKADIAGIGKKITESVEPVEDVRDKIFEEKK